MKKIVAPLALSLLLSSCIVIKVYDSPKDENESPKVTVKKRMMLPSDKMVPLPTGPQEFLFIGEEFPPEPMLFHGKEDTLLIDIKGDSIAQKGVFVIKLDASDSLASPMQLKWKVKDGTSFQHPPIPLPHGSMMTIGACCPAMDSLCSGMPKMKKRIRVIKKETDKEEAKENIFVFRSKEDSASPLIIIDGVEQSAGYDLKKLSTDNIERIDVLKDEAAFKKVGEKGVNGVILITTKKN